MGHESAFKGITVIQHEYCEYIRFSVNREMKISKNTRENNKFNLRVHDCHVSTVSLNRSIHSQLFYDRFLCLITINKYWRLESYL